MSFFTLHNLLCFCVNTMWNFVCILFTLYTLSALQLPSKLKYFLTLSAFYALCYLCVQPVYTPLCYSASMIFHIYNATQVPPVLPPIHHLTLPQSRFPIITMSLYCIHEVNPSPLAKNAQILISEPRFTPRSKAAPGGANRIHFIIQPF